MGLVEPIRRRLDAARRSLGDGDDPRAAMAAALLLLFAAGTVLALAAIPLSDDLSGEEKLAELVICDVAAVACLVIAFLWRRLSMLAFQALLVLGTLMITAGTYFASSGPTDTEVFYIWVALYASYFLTRREAFFHVAVIGLCYAGVLALGRDSGAEAGRWLITMGSVVVATLLFGYIKELLDRRLAEKERSERELEEALSLQRSIQARLRYLADHDPLTGLLNRRRFEAELADRVAQAGRYGGGGALVLLDLDDFKSINDSLGHPAGDAVIKSTAALLREQLRETDVLARLGGDELAVLLPRASAEQARRVAAKLVEAVRGHRVPFKGKRLRVTTSVGVAPISQPRTQSAEDLMVEADIAVYGAKAAGRDRVRVHRAAADRRPKVETLAG
jgi:diguanylate cyclase (GGDEF)-like protein